MINTDDEIFHPDFDLGDFRYAVARYVKLLIRARWKCDPGFLPQAELHAWGLQDIERDSWPTWRLVDQAAASLARLNREFLPRCGSGGVRETDESTPVGRLVFTVAFLADFVGGGPEHNLPLVTAARSLRDGKCVDWQSLVNWAMLPAIRADLDLLPHPQPEAALTRLDRIEAALNVLVEGQTVKEWYSTNEIAQIVGKAEYTVREYCRQGRIRAKKKPCGRGKGGEWLVSHDELTRLKNEGLLPPPKHS